MRSSFRRTALKGRAIQGCTALINGGNLNRRNAIRALENRASANPKAEMTYDFRGRLYGKKADYAAALTDLTKSLEVKPSIFAYADRAEIYEKMEDHARAIADYTKALELDPGSTFGLEFYTKRADAHMASGDYKSAVADYTKAIDVDPTHVELTDRNSTTAELFNRRAMALLSAGQRAEALQDSEHSLVLWPGDPAALTTHGRVLDALGRRDEAIADFQRALTHAPDYVEAKAALTKLGVAAKPPDEMQVLLKRIIDLDHEYKRDEAITAGNEYARAVELRTGTESPEYAFALDVLVDLYLARNQLDEAERAARRALAIRESAAVPDRLEKCKERDQSRNDLECGS